MIKTEQKIVSHEAKMILQLINRVRVKMMGLGISSQESKQRILTQIRTSIKIKCDSPVNLERMVISRIKSKGISKKCFNKLATRLDFLENSIQESDDSESQPSAKVKSQHVVPVVKEKTDLPQLSRSRVSELKMKHYDHYRLLMGQQMDDEEEIKRFLMRKRKELTLEKKLISLNTMGR